ncbi:putative short-chain oxidoreductase [Leptodontidium sp. 2 PMI_412]|nr:putative short-chain oxidoreductase [Leptodontidium sp. 2 PMI_412]
MSSKQLTWFITGTSSGFGEIFVRQIIARGDRVVASARSLSKIQALKDAGAAIIEMDVNSPQEILDGQAAKAIAIYGEIDVLVNNAGYVKVGTLEDTSSEEWMSQYQTNVFGAVNVTRAFLPHFRRKKNGTVVWIGSLGGWRSDAVQGPYCSSKFALAGIAESFYDEMKPLGIHSLLVEPGYFRTKLLSDKNSSLIPTKFPEYEPVTRAMYDTFRSYNGKQPGDPEKGVARILDVIRQEGLASGKGIPMRLILGPDAVSEVRKKCLDTLDLVKEWEELSTSTNLEE